MSKITGVSIFLLMWICVSVIYLCFSAPYQILLPQQYGVLTEVSSLLSSMEFDKINIWSSSIVIYSILSVFDWLLNSITVLKVYLVLISSLSLILWFWIAVQKNLDVSLSYLLTPFFFSTVFIYGEIHILTALCLFLLLYGFLDNKNAEVKNNLFVCVLFMALCFTSPILAFISFPLLLWEGFYKLSPQELRVKRLMMFLPGVMILLSFGFKFLISYSVQDMVVGYKYIGESIIGFVNSVYITDELEHLQFLLPIVFLLSPFGLGFRFTKEINKWMFFIYCLTIYLLLPKQIEGYRYYGYITAIIPLMSYPFLFEKRSEKYSYLWTIPLFIVCVSIYSYIDKSRQQGNSVKDLFELNSEQLIGKKIWNDSISRGFTGMFLDNISHGHWLNVQHGIFIEYSLLNRMDSPVYVENSIKSDPVFTDKAWLSDSIKSTYDYLLLYNCDEVKPSVVPLAFIENNNCWYIYKY